MDRFSLVDIWRVKYPNNRSFTRSNKSGSSQSRIDFWLISESFYFKDVIDVDILPTPLTDHKAICIKINLSTVDKCAVQSGYWTLNSSLLLNDDVKKEVKGLISHFWSKAKEEKHFGVNWELFKFEVGKYLRRYGSLKAKSRRAEEEKVVSRITLLSQKSPDTLLEEEKLELANLQVKLDELYSQKAKGAFVRS